MVCRDTPRVCVQLGMSLCGGVRVPIEETARSTGFSIGRSLLYCPVYPMGLVADVSCPGQDGFYATKSIDVDEGRASRT